MRRLGIDIGSLYVSAVLMVDAEIACVRYREHSGDIGEGLRELGRDPSLQGCQRTGITGRLPGRCEHLIDPFLAVIEGARFLLPGVRNVFSVGGQSFALIFYDEDGKYREHSVNPPCAAGTGSFIEQQARRLGLTVEEFTRRAQAHGGKRPLIATRCAVFAKTDIVHAMQEGYSLEAVCVGLCEGIAGNLIDVLVKGRRLAAPAGIVGGVSRNSPIVRALEAGLGCRVVAPDYAYAAGAVGAALLAEEAAAIPDLAGLGPRPGRSIRPPLNRQLADYPDFSRFRIIQDGEVESFLPAEQPRPVGNLFLGIDIGSTSTKTALLDGEHTFIGGLYTPTAGDPVQAVCRLIRSMDALWPEARRRLSGVATTGSGRKMIRELFRADMDVDEITAHARAAVMLTPEVDTILEIGGQDSKFTRLRDGQVYFSTMNYACAAGTGSFIEEQALRLGVSLQRFAEMALSAEAPFTSDRCTVYMERDLGVLLAEGWSRESLTAAVLHSVRDNYLAKVVNRSPLGRYIVFQGATGRNPALVASFEQHLGQSVHVSPFCHLTGAIGAALLGLEAIGVRAEADSQFLWDGAGVGLVAEECGLCANRCLLTVANSGEHRSAWGMKCGREYSARARKRDEPSQPELRFRSAMHPLLEEGGSRVPWRSARIGLPAALYESELYPLWHGFLSRLGFQVVASRPARQALEVGRSLVNSDFCAPMIAAHGYVQQLVEDGVDFLFFPAVVNEEDSALPEERLYRRKTTDDYFCYYSQYLPTIVSKLTTLDLKERLIAPLVFLHRRSAEQVAGDLHAELVRFVPELLREEVREAYAEARRGYQECKAAWKREAALRLASSDADRLRVALLGRPYVIFDRALNMDLPRKLEELGVEVFWQEELEEGQPVLGYAGKYYERMHWHYGKSILRAAELSARTEGLYPVFLTCFRCSPDSFLISYVKDVMDHYRKPFLVLQLDEHASDVGYTTRIEAGLRSFRNHLRATGLQGAAAPEIRASRPRNDALAEGDTVLVLYLDRLISRFWVDSFVRGGYDALLLEADEKALATGYRYANGGECMPLVSILGGAIEAIKGRGLDPRRTFFYLPTSCWACNFPQFPILAELVFRSAGLEGVKIGLLNSMALAEGLPQSLAVKIFESYIVAGILYKLRHRIQPYEVRRGETEEVFLSAVERVSEGIRAGRDLRVILGEEVRRFRGITRDESSGRRPRIGVLGDLYVKYSEAVNQRVLSLVEELGGELVIPSLSEYALHYFYADVRFNGDDPRHYQLLRSIENRYEKLAADLIGEQLEPDFAECARLMDEYRIRHFIVGETSINVGRALYYLDRGSVDALIHLNPIFCCPGVVTSSIYRKIQEDFGVPIVDIFYDGTGSPNQILIPHLSYLRKRTSVPEAPARGSGR